MDTSEQIAYAVGVINELNCGHEGIQYYLETDSYDWCVNCNDFTLFSTWEECLYDDKDIQKNLITLLPERLKDAVDELAELISPSK